MNEKRKSELYVIIAAVLWGFIGVSVTALVRAGISRIAVGFVRAFIAFVSLAIYLFFTDKSAFKIRLKDAWCFFGTGVVGLFMFNVCYFTAMKMTSIAVAAVLLYTAPGFVIVLSAILFKEKITSIKVISMCTMFAGCILVSGIFEGGASFGVSGMLIGICSGVGYALYSIFGRFALNRDYSSATISLYTFAFAAAGGAVLTDFSALFGAMSGNVLLHSLFVGVVCCMLPYLFYTKGMENMDNGKASVLAMAEPLVAAIVSVFIDGMPSVYEVCGMVVMFGGIAFMSLKRE